MRNEIIGALFLTLVPCFGQAQSRDYSKGHAIFYYAPGGVVAGRDEWNKPTIQFGVGGEGFFKPHWGVGADVAYLRSPAGDRIAPRNWFVLSPRLVARWLVPDGKDRIEAFATGGYSLIRREHSPNGVVFGETPRTWWETENAMNLGGGFNLWFAKYVGLRFELRDCIRQLADYGGGHHLVSIHIGLTVR